VLQSRAILEEQRLWFAVLHGFMRADRHQHFRSTILSQDKRVISGPAEVARIKELPRQRQSYIASFKGWKKLESEQRGSAVAGAGAPDVGGLVDFVSV
jgi:hypothetical protein